MFNINDKVKIIDITNVRRTPGYVNKDEYDVFILAQPGQTFLVASGSYQADEIYWYELDLGDQRGYVAEGHSGNIFLVADTESEPTIGGIKLTCPLYGSIAMSQNWDENPASYAQIQGYRPPLRDHNGRDYAALIGSSVMACDGGVVESAEMNRWGFGNLCVLRHSWGKSYYAHLSAFDVPVGAWVSYGQHSRAVETLDWGWGRMGPVRLIFTSQSRSSDKTIRRMDGWVLRSNLLFRQPLLKKI